MNDGEPTVILQDITERAFPHKGGYGMSLRDWFAGMALQGLLGNNPERFYDVKRAKIRRDILVAEWSYAYADAMLTQREKES